MYAATRGVSRVYQMSFHDGHWKMWRNDPNFSQRFQTALDHDGTTISGRWKKSFAAGATSEHDFDIDYIR